MSEQKNSFLYIGENGKAEWGAPEGYPYKEIGTILNGTFEFIDNRGIYIYQITDENFTIVDGKSYTVIWDGETYQFVATIVQGALTLGNLGILGAGADTGEPFLFIDQGIGQKLITTNSTAATHMITISEKIVYPIASEFLPDSVKNRMSLIVINAQMPNSASWKSVTYGNGKFVAITSDSNRAAYSENGINWTASTMSSSGNWQSITYGNGKFIAVAYHSKSAYSEDGINWTASTMPGSIFWCSVTYDNGKFVAVAENSNQSAYSKDGINWKTTFEYLSQNNSNITESVRSVIGIPAYSTTNNGQFLRVIDGIPTWTEFLPTLTSPNGTKYQLTVSDDGTLSAVAVS